VIHIVTNISKIARGAALLAAFVLMGCASAAKLPVAAGTGPNPTLPAPQHALIPLVHVVDAQGWPAGATPIAANGLAVTAFAQGLQHPRWLYVLPSGDVLVAETNAPERPLDGRGIKGWFFKLFQKKAGGDAAGGQPLRARRGERLAAGSAGTPAAIAALRSAAFSMMRS